MAMTKCRRENDGSLFENSGFLPGLPDDTALEILVRTSRSDYPIVSCLNKGLNSLIKSGYLYKLRRTLGIVEPWVFLACTLMPWTSFDPTRQKWAPLPPIPCDECFKYADRESLAVGTDLLVFGREVPAFAIWKYSILTRDWSRCHLMNSPRCLFGSSSLGEIAVVAGGCDGKGNVMGVAEAYNSETGIWQMLPELNVARKNCSGFSMDGKFYVLGGMSAPRTSLTCGEEFDFETGKWRRILNMYPFAVEGQEAAYHAPPLVAVVNNQLYVADRMTNEIKKYNKQNNSWRVVNVLPRRPGASKYGWGVAFKACGNHMLLVMVGRTAGHTDVIVVLAWEPDSGNGDWKVLSAREEAGANFIYNCAVMNC